MKLQDKTIIFLLRLYTQNIRLFFLVDTTKTPFIDQTRSKDANEVFIATF